MFLLQYLFDNLPIILTVLFMGVLFYIREEYYSILNRLLESKSVWLRILGELLSLADSFIKACGLNIVLFSTLQLSWGFVIFFTVSFFLLRYFFFPRVERSFSTRCFWDDTLFFLFLLLQGVGAYKGIVILYNNVVLN